MVEVSLFTKSKETWTKIKVSVKEINKMDMANPEFIIGLTKIIGDPIKKSSRYYYWELRGDYINMNLRKGSNG